MKTKTIGLIITAFVMSLSFAPVASACASNELPGCDGDGGDPPTKTKGNNGLGNGNQAAPGNSLTNNKAENQSTAVSPGEHPSGKDQIPN